MRNLINKIGLSKALLIADIADSLVIATIYYIAMMILVNNSIHHIPSIIAYLLIAFGIFSQIFRANCRKRFNG